MSAEKDPEILKSYREEIISIAKHKRKFNLREVDDLIEFERSIVKIAKGRYSPEILTIKELQEVGSWVINYQINYV